MTEICDNGIDEDCDTTNNSCTPQEQFFCNDGLDNDSDGNIDCLDSDCASNMDYCQSCSALIANPDTSVTSYIGEPREFTCNF
jgi:hypothetical protein